MELDRSNSGQNSPEQCSTGHQTTTERKLVQRVEIRVKGRIDKDWSDWFEGLTISHADKDETTLTGEVADQSALYGLIARLRDLGLPLVSVKANPSIAKSNQKGV